jgi:hypothetical protein
MILILFYGDNLGTAVLDQMKFGTVNVHGHSYKFYLIYYFVWLNFKYGEGAKFCGCLDKRWKNLCRILYILQRYILVKHLIFAINKWW